MEMTDGAHMLRRILENRPEETQLVARTLDVSTQAIWTWKTGSRRPDAYIRDGLLALLSIPQEKWLTAEEKRVLRRARRVAAVRARS